MPSGPIYENRPKMLIPQWRDQPRLQRSILAPVQNDWYTIFDATRPTGYLSDAQIAFMDIVHNTGANASIRFRAHVDGTPYMVDIAVAVSGTRYYLYLDPFLDELVADVNIRMAQYYNTWNGESAWFEIRADDAGVSDLIGTVRYQQL